MDSSNWPTQAELGRDDLRIANCEGRDNTGDGRSREGSGGGDEQCGRARADGRKRSAMT